MYNKFYFLVETNSTATVDWGNGDIETINSTNDNNINHIVEKTYTDGSSQRKVTITGDVKLCKPGGGSATSSAINLLTATVSGMSTIEYCNSMFENCRNATSIDVSNFDTSNVHFFTRMFQNCWRITSLDVSNFTLAGQNNYGFVHMTQLFLNCFST